MDDGGGCLLTILCVVLLALVSNCGYDAGAAGERRRWRECRTLLTTRDSAAVLAARPECAQWTWPPPKEAP